MHEDSGGITNKFLFVKLHLKILDMSKCHSSLWMFTALDYTSGALYLKTSLRCLNGHNGCVVLLFFRDCVCSLNDEVELVQASDSAHGCCQANGGQWLERYFSPRRISLHWQLHWTSQQERCLRRDQKQVPEWNRQDPTWVPGKTWTCSDHPNLIDVTRNNVFGNWIFSFAAGISSPIMSLFNIDYGLLFLMAGKSNFHPV